MINIFKTAFTKALSGFFLIIMILASGYFGMKYIKSVASEELKVKKEQVVIKTKTMINNSKIYYKQKKDAVLAKFNKKDNTKQPVSAIILTETLVEDTPVKKTSIKEKFTSFKDKYFKKKTSEEDVK